MGALVGRCLDWSGDPDPVSCQLMWGKSTGSNRQRQFQHQLQQQQHQQQTRKSAQEDLSCSASGAGFHGRSHDARKSPHWSFSNPHRTDSPPSPSFRSSKESGWSGIYSGGPATTQPPAEYPPSSSAARFMPVHHHHHHHHQDQTPPDSAPGSPGTFGFPQPGPGAGVGSMGGQDLQQHPSRQLQWRDDFSHKVRQTFSVRQGSARSDNPDPETIPSRRLHGGNRVQISRMTSSE